MRYMTQLIVNTLYMGLLVLFFFFPCLKAEDYKTKGEMQASSFFHSLLVQQDLPKQKQKHPPFV